MSRETTLPLDRIHELVDEYRATCLWYMREDYYPQTLDQVQDALDAIARHGDVEAFRKVEEVRRWVSRRSS